MTHFPPDTLVSTDWLFEHLSAPDVRVVDGSWYLPRENRDARAEYRAAHIPGAVFFDIDDIADTGSPYPHMLPPAEKFSSRMRKLGLGAGHTIVVYDGAGLFSAARVWWMFKVMGHTQVAVLDGGMPKWRAENKPLEDHVPMPRERHFIARVDTTRLRVIDEIKANIDSGREILVDARSKKRFAGAEAEPRAGVRAGHIPDSLNLPYGDLLNADGTMRQAGELELLFRSKGVGTDKPVVTSCGSGITAAILALGLEVIGHRKVAVYDGSWAEWGARTDMPLATGPSA